MTCSMIRNTRSSERGEDAARNSASICAMTGNAREDGRLGAEKRKRLVEAVVAAISLNSSS